MENGFGKMKESERLPQQKYNNLIWMDSVENSVISNQNLGSRNSSNDDDTDDVHAAKSTSKVQPQIHSQEEAVADIGKVI